MGKAMRKPRPAVPNWVWLDRDGCWDCPDRNHCNSCKKNKQYIAKERKRKDKREKQNIKKNLV